VIRNVTRPKILVEAVLARFGNFVIQRAWQRDLALAEARDD
jgi:hypothetical protein